jgi:endonuclease YncB( thermonuclease family)
VSTDGDTLRVQRQGREERLRLCGIDAPELDQPLGPEARDHLRGLLAGHDEVLVMAVERDRYGRLVAELWTGADGVNDVNVELPDGAGRLRLPLRAVFWQLPQSAGDHECGADRPG